MNKPNEPVSLLPEDMGGVDLKVTHDPVVLNTLLLRYLDADGPTATPISRPRSPTMGPPLLPGEEFAELIGRGGADRTGGGAADQHHGPVLAHRPSQVSVAPIVGRMPCWSHRSERGVRSRR